MREIPMGFFGGADRKGVLHLNTAVDVWCAIGSLYPGQHSSLDAVFDVSADDSDDSTSEGDGICSTPGAAASRASIPFTTESTDIFAAKDSAGNAFAGFTKEHWLALKSIYSTYKADNGDWTQCNVECTELESGGTNITVTGSDAPDLELALSNGTLVQTFKAESVGTRDEFPVKVLTPAQYKLLCECLVIKKGPDPDSKNLLELHRQFIRELDVPFYHRIRVSLNTRAGISPTVRVYARGDSDFQLNANGVIYMKSEGDEVTVLRTDPAPCNTDLDFKVSWITLGGVRHDLSQVVCPEEKTVTP